jgi:hypothetical protein
MTQKANPSINRPIEAFKTSGAIALAGGSSEGWISNSGTPSDISAQDDSIDENSLNAFAQTSNSSSLSISIEGGEAFVYGAWIAIDTSTSVTLSASTAGQTVYVGWNKDGTNDVIVGLDAAFSDASGDTDEKVPLFTYDTDGSGVTAVTDERQLGKYVPADSIDAAKELNIPVYSDSSNASDELGDLIYIDGAGSQVEGLYTYDGAGYVSSGKTEEDIQRLSTNRGAVRRTLAADESFTIGEDESLIVLDYFDEGTGDLTVQGDFLILNQ